MKIGILNTGNPPDELSAEFGDYTFMFQELLGAQDFSFVGYDVERKSEVPTDCRDADAWLITGSKHGVYDDLPWMAPLKKFIRSAYDLNTPIVGICFGHQIVAQALGGQVEKFLGGWSAGRVEYTFHDESEIVPLFAWHKDQVVKRPSDARLVASSPFCENAMLQYGNKALTIQPHPEFEERYFRQLMRIRGPKNVPPDILKAAYQSLANQVATDRIVAIIHEFLLSR